MKNAVAAGLAAGLFVAGLAIGALYAQPLQVAEKPPEGTTRKVTLVAQESILQVSPDNELHPGGVSYRAMTFNGTIPGPMIFVNQGDTVEITLKNVDDTVHSLNFHAVAGPGNALSGTVKPGESRTWSFVASTPGAFVYHCDGDNLNGIWEHIASGMYGGIVVRSGHEKPAKEFYVVFGELYNSADKGLFSGTAGEVGSFDFEKFAENNPDLVLTNGMAYRYIPALGTSSRIVLNENAEIFNVTAGELTRWYIINAGPRGYLAFNFGAGTIDVKDALVDRDGKQASDEVWTIPPGSASIIETVFPEEGYYFGNDHDIGRLLAGGGFAIRAG